MDFKEVLQKTEVFGGLSEKELGTVVTLCDRESYEAGTQLSRQGQEIGKVYVVEKGLVQFQIEVGPGRFWSVDSSGKRDCFGWAALLNPPHPWASFARCVEPTTLVTVDAIQLRDLCMAEPGIGHIVMLGIAGLISHRLDNTRIQLAHVAEKM